MLHPGRWGEWLVVLVVVVLVMIVVVVYGCGNRIGWDCYCDVDGHSDCGS